MLFRKEDLSIALSTPEDASVAHLASNLQGVMSTADLRLLIGQTDCVGIRVYNAVESQTDIRKRVLIVGIRKNGSEKDGRGSVGYLLSPPFDPTSIARATETSTRVEAANKVDLGVNRGVTSPFSSYFSNDAITKLLEDKNNQSVVGIGFYISTIDLDLGQPFDTHIGVSMVGTSNIQPVADNPAFSHIKSNKPCPGVCVAILNRNDTSISDAETQRTEYADNSTIYLVDWNPSKERVRE
jgi:hypothetical protein